MQIIGCQMNIDWEAPGLNLRRADQLFSNTTVPSNSLLVLPEMFATGFSMNVGRIANAPQVPPFLSTLSSRYHSTLIAGYVGQAADGRGCNQALIYSPQGVRLGAYQKIHPFSFAGEDKVYEPGRSVQIFELGEFRICPFICYDLRFPEIFRTATLRGANTFVVIANWPAPRTEHWTALLRARAIENQAFVIGLNRTGSDPKLEYSGRSVVFGPQGEVLCELDNKEGILQADLDIESVTRWRARFPALADIHHAFTPES